jgi:hypothetical protein
MLACRPSQAAIPATLRIGLCLDCDQILVTKSLVVAGSCGYTHGENPGESNHKMDA